MRMRWGLGTDNDLWLTAIKEMNISILQEKKLDSADTIIKSRFFLPPPPIPSEISVRPTFLLGSV